MKNTEITQDSRNLVIELAKSLNVDFPKDKTCKDCYHYDYGDEGNSWYPNQHSCWEEHKVDKRPPDLDDMGNEDYVDPYVICDLEQAVSCPYYKSGLDEYKRLYNESKKELDKLKEDIKNLCR